MPKLNLNDAPNSLHVKELHRESDPNGLDATRIADRLWQGAFPQPGSYLARRGFSLLALCADEWQPPGYLYPEVQVIHAPNFDGDEPFTQELYEKARGAARCVANHWRNGGRALVTCAMGVNRSGLVMALTLADLAPTAPMEDIIKRIQTLRRRGQYYGLCNPDFVEALLLGHVPIRHRRRAGGRS